MPSMDVITDGDRAWPDLPALAEAGQLIDAMGEGGARLSVALLRGGMRSGGASVTFRIDLPDGRVVLTETSLALFGLAADVLREAAQR